MGRKRSVAVSELRAIRTTNLTIDCLLQLCREHLFHQERPPAAARRIKLAPAVGPDWIRDAAKGHQTLIVSLLIAVINSLAGEQSVAIMLIRADRAYTSVRARKRRAAIL